MPRVVGPYGDNGFFIFTGHLLRAGKVDSNTRRVGFLETNWGGTAEKIPSLYRGGFFIAKMTTAMREVKCARSQVYY